MSTGPKAVSRPGASRRGGYRPNSGPKPIYILAETERRRIIKALRVAERKHGKSIGELMAEWIYSDDFKRASVTLQVYLRDVLARTTHQDVTVTKSAEGPHIYLPEAKPDPAKVVALTQERKA